jgi:hypothetical protein
LAPSSGYDHAHYDITCRSKRIGTLIDIVQRQPASVTRRGRPVAVIQSSQNAPLRGSSDGDVMRENFSKMSNQAAKDGLKEIDIIRMLNAEE